MDEGASGEGLAMGNSGLPEDTGGFEPSRLVNVYSSSRVLRDGTNHRLRTSRKPAPVSVLPLRAHAGVFELEASSPEKSKLKLRPLLPNSSVASKLPLHTLILVVTPG